MPNLVEIGQVYPERRKSRKFEKFTDEKKTDGRKDRRTNGPSGWTDRKTPDNR